MNELLEHARPTEALEALFVAGTPADVQARYRQLPQLAREAAFSLAERPVIVCDTETTGLHADSDALIEIAAVRLCGCEVQEEFHTLVNPGRAIPAEIEELTGITAADVAGAPSPREAVAAFAQFAGHDALVAHNAGFDRGFLLAQAEPGALSTTWHDTLALARIVLPRLSGHKLGQLAAAFNLARPSHRALDDVHALAGLWRLLLAGCCNLAPGLAGCIATLSPETSWPLRPLFEQAAGLQPGVDFSLRSTRARRVGEATAAARQDARDVPLRFAPDEEVARAFGPDGLLAGMYPGYEPRQPQQQMALEVNAALREGSMRALEAGTGVGKSMAYLVPLALTARENHITMGVATKTNALMDQLVYHELPRLAQALGGLDYVTLKGYEHYPCLRKLEATVRASTDAAVEEVELLAALLSFAADTCWGDLDALNLHWLPQLRARIQANPNDCLKNRCPFFPRLCYLHGARRHANAADVVVTNHALLFRDAQLAGGILPPVRHWVIDEAHSAEAEARKQLSHTCSQVELEGLLRRLAGPHGSIVSSLRTKADKLPGANLLYGPCADIEERVANITAVETSFFSYVKELASVGGERDAGYDRMSLWVGPELRASGAWAALERPGRSLVEKLEGLVRRLNDIVSLAEEFEGKLAAQQADLANASCNLRELLDALVLVLEGTDESYVYSVELDRRSAKKAEVLCAAKLDVGAELAAMFYPEVRSVVFASATLATRGAAGSSAAGGGPAGGGLAGGRAAENGGEESGRSTFSEFCREDSTSRRISEGQNEAFPSTCGAGAAPGHPVSGDGSPSRLEWPCTGLQNSEKVEQLTSISARFTQTDAAGGGLASGSGATASNKRSAEAFRHFEHAVGLDLLPPERVGARQLASSYDFNGHMSVLLPADLPDPGARNWRRELAQLLLDVHVAMGGSVLTLFTNRREMESLYYELKPQLQQGGIELAAQLRSSSAATLRERFLAEHTLSLFALKSFWEGFDAPGDTLRCVVIPKLPFGKPSEPLAREREARERNAWFRYSLPASVIELKQAAGRLIRSSTDEGWLILCDARLRTKRYGKTFLNAMPTSDIRTLGTDELLETLRTQHPGQREA